MKERFIVLRGPRGVFRDVFRGGPEVTVAGAATEISVQIEELERREVPTLSRDVGVVAVAPAMPMRLIEPVESREVSAKQAASTAWGVQAVKADTSPFSGAGIVVAVLDTGIDPQHEAFAGVKLICRNFTSDVDDDTDGHGTHCAGTIFGHMNSTRIGVATGVKCALIAKVLGKGGGSSEQLVNAIKWATDNGAHVVSMSLGIDFPGFVCRMVEGGRMPVELATSRALEGYRLNVLLFERLAALIRVRAQPTMIVAAAGNESRRDVNSGFVISVSPPAVSEGIVSVAALGVGINGLKIAAFSNTGASVSGPGVDVMSANVGGGLVSKSGTSMATPHVAGVAALWAEKMMRLGPLNSSQLVARLIGNARFDEIGAGFDPSDVGAGLVQAPPA